MPDFLGATVAGLFVTLLDNAFMGLWTASLGLLRVAFEIADTFTVFTLAGPDGQLDPTSPIAVYFPLLRTLSFAVALGLLFVQIIRMVLHGGRGFWRAATGPLMYAVALATTVGGIAAFLLAADGITEVLLQQGLQADNFRSVLARGHFGDLAIAGVGGVVLGLIALLGVLPAAFGYILEMIFRQAATLVLVGTSPVTAAGLLSDTTSSWYWRTLRWSLAVILIKPALALVLVIGVSMVGQAEGLPGLLGGVGVLLIALFCPFVLFRLLAFVDPNTDPGAGLRDWFRQTASNLSGGGGSGGGGGTGGGGSGSGSGSMEDASYARFDDSLSSYAGTEMDDTGVGAPPPRYSGFGEGGSSGSGSGGPGGGGGSGSHGDPHDGFEPPGSGGPGGGRGPGRPGGPGGGGAGAGGAGEAAAVIV